LKAFIINCDYKGDKFSLAANGHTRKVKNANLHYSNPTFYYEECRVPEIKPDTVLIKVLRVGLCGSDYHCIETDENGFVLFSGPAQFPQIPGHEFTGQVEAVGAEVSEFAPGDYVSSESVLWCGSCLSCRQGFFSECEKSELLGLTTNGALASHIAVPHRFVWKINDLCNNYDLDRVLNIGCLLEPVGCAYKGIFLNSMYRFFPGARAAVFGAGPIGLGAAWLLKISGASKIYLFEKNKHRIETARAMGFKNVINVTEIPSISSFLMKETGSRGVDISVECSGAGNEVLSEIIESKSAKGVVIYLSRTGKRNFHMNADRMMSLGNSLIGSRGHASSFHYIIRLMEMKENLYIEKMITRTVTFDSLKSFLESREYTKETKVIVTMNNEVSNN
jgi:threonine dehydrogenase-like Zn-dependent dehydrogenase